jgi:sulfur-oxidizing protein SoxA
MSIKQGLNLRADIPSPAIGHPTHFPVYRSGMGRLVTLHERFCWMFKSYKSKRLKGGSDELE